MIQDYKKAQLVDNYTRGNNEISFKDWVITESDCDANFFSWLFGDDNIEGYTDLSNEQAQEFESYLSDL